MLPHLRPRPALAVFLFALALVTAARAQVVFTVTATANANAAGYGYTQGQAYTFVLTIPGDYASPDSSFASNQHDYADEDTTMDTNLFTSIGGTGLNGSFVRPVAQTISPYSSVVTQNATQLIIYAGSDTGGSIGLQALNAATVGYIDVNLPNVTSFALLTYYQAPADYFLPYAGSYSLIAGTVQLGDSSGNAAFATFNATNVAIAVTPIPEPATTAGLLGLAGLAAGLVARRRRLPA